MIDMQTRGDVASLAARLRNGGARLRKEVTKELTAVGKPMEDAARQAALREFPHRGGLNVWLADAEFFVKVWGGRNPTLTIRATKRGHDLRAADRGIIRHPVYGHKDRKWAFTEVRPHIFTDAVEKVADAQMVSRLIEAANRVITESR